MDTRAQARQQCVAAKAKNAARSHLGKAKNKAKAKNMARKFKRHASKANESANPRKLAQRKQAMVCKWRQQVRREQKAQLLERCAETSSIRAGSVKVTEIKVNGDTPGVRICTSGGVKNQNGKRVPFIRRALGRSCYNTRSSHAVVTRH